MKASHVFDEGLSPERKVRTRWRKWTNRWAEIYWINSDLPCTYTNNKCCRKNSESRKKVRRICLVVGTSQKELANECFICIDVHHLNLDTDDLVADLQFRQRLESTVRGMKQLVTFLSAQLSTAKSLHQEEIRVADECGQVKEALTSKIKEIETSEAPSVT